MGIGTPGNVPWPFRDRKRAENVGQPSSKLPDQAGSKELMETVVAGVAAVNLIINNPAGGKAP